MECPKCNNGMIQGFIQSAREIFWSTKNMRCGLPLINVRAKYG